MKKHWLENLELLRRVRLISALGENPSAANGSAAHMVVRPVLAHLSLWCCTVRSSFVASTFLTEREATFLLLILGEVRVGGGKNDLKFRPGHVKNGLIL